MHEYSKPANSSNHSASYIYDLNEEETIEKSEAFYVLTNPQEKQPGSWQVKCLLRMLMKAVKFCIIPATAMLVSLT